MATLAEFRAQYREFPATADVAGALARAASELDEDAWGPLYESALGLRPAAILANSPSGMNARLDSEDGKTSTYQKQFEDLQLQASCCLSRVV